MRPKIAPSAAAVLLHGDEAAGMSPDALLAVDESRSVKRQIALLLRKQLALKRRGWKWTLLEVVFPLQPIFFLWVCFALGGKYIPYGHEVKEAKGFVPEQPANPAVGLANSSVGLFGIMHLGGSVGFAPAQGSANTARAVYSLICGSYEAALATPQYANLTQQAESLALQWGRTACATDSDGIECKILSSIGTASPGSCVWFDSAAQLDAAGGWFPFANAAAGPGGTGSDGMDLSGGLYIGVEVGPSKLLIRHENLILVDDANGDPEEQNTLRSGLIAFQTIGSLALMGACSL